MLFPSTSILDDFNRANTGPPPSASWTTVTNGLKVVSNVAAPVSASTGVSNSVYWNASTFGPNMEIFCDLGTRGGTFDEVDMYLRANTAISVGYTILWYNSVVEVYQKPDEVTKIGASITRVIAAGDSLGASVYGSTIYIYYKASGSSWSLIGTRTDSTNSGNSGNDRLGLGIFSGTDVNMRLDNFGGGTIVTPSIKINSLRPRIFAPGIAR